MATAIAAVPTPAPPSAADAKDAKGAVAVSAAAAPKASSSSAEVSESSLHPCFAVRAPALSDQPAITEIGSFTFGGNDYVPTAFPLWLKPASGCHVFVIEYRGLTTATATAKGVGAGVTGQWSGHFKAGQLVGVINLKVIDGEQTAWIEGLRVHPNAQRLGLAALLMKLCVDRAAALPRVTAIRYTTGADNGGSLALAAKFGLPVVYSLLYDYFDVTTAPTPAAATAASPAAAEAASATPKATSGDPSKSVGVSLEVRIPQVLQLIEQQLPTATTASVNASASSADASSLFVPNASIEAVLALVNGMTDKYTAQALARGVPSDTPQWSALWGDALHWRRMQSQWKAWNWTAANLQSLFVDLQKPLVLGVNGSAAAGALTLSGVQQFVDGVALTFSIFADSYGAFLVHLRRVLTLALQYYNANATTAAGAKRLKELFVFYRSDFGSRLYGAVPKEKHTVLIERDTTTTAKAK